MTAAWRGAVIGFGNVAANGHLPGWRECDDFRIVAVADPDPARRADAARHVPGAHTYADYAELLRHEQLDFVDIAAPPASHTPMIEAAAAAGVHVLCEKPLTTSLAELERIEHAVRRSGIILHTVHNWKYSEAYRVLRDSLDSLGPVRLVSFDTVRNGCAASSGANWRMDPKIAGGGILVDHGWHAFYLMLALAEEWPLRIAADLQRRRYESAEVEDTAHCRVDFPSITGEIHLTWAAEERRTRWTVHAHKGSVIIDDDRITVTSDGTPVERRLNSALSASSHHPDWFGGVISEFRAALLSRDPSSSNQTEAALCVQLLHQAYASNRRRQPMEIPLHNAIRREVSA